MDALQDSLFAASAPRRVEPAAGYGRRVTDRMLVLLGAPHAMEFEQAWRRTLEEMPAPIGWRGSGRRGEQSPVEFLHDRLALAWYDDDALELDIADLSVLFDGSASARHATGPRRATPAGRVA